MHDSNGTYQSLGAKSATHNTNGLNAAAINGAAQTHSGYKEGAHGRANYAASCARLKEYIRQEGVETTCHRSDFLFRQGERVGKVFLVDQGLAAIVHLCENDHRQVYDFIFKDSIILDTSRHSGQVAYSVQCLSDMRMHVLSTDSFERILKAEPDLKDAVDEILVAMLERSQRNLGNILCRQGESRVAFILAAVYNDNNRDALKAGATTRLDDQIAVKQIDLAAAVGVTPVYFNQILKKMADADMIKLSRGKIHVKNLKSIELAS